MGEAADQTKGMASDTRKVADWLYRTGEEMRDELQKGMEMAKDDIQRATETVKDEVTKLNEATAMVFTGTGKVGGCQHDEAHGGITYADALNRWLPAAHLSTLVRGQVKDRQVLIDKDPVSQSNQLAGLNERKLVAKIDLHVIPFLCIMYLLAFLDRYDILVQTFDQLRNWAFIN